ncbi:hypothetical protein M378DRAFT_163271 [Amanita muscaria Koide BX008]|uniref:Uncharacterized protein n=1 Tax=Amanita muscaria (strain Koide BX008) TaxID=946122 RepID=A0A0C2WS40_AMAMK|nr:hypothetical protein M378DRAFT_163271 [Amanita muscaria Koide BX008]
MAYPSVRTKSHIYPQEEIDAMCSFYKDKRCVIQNRPENSVWAHIMDAAITPSNLRLSQMLTRKLRQDRHPRHAAEVRENIVPLNVDHHMLMDGRPTRATLFLHEDLLARTLDYEQDLCDWRLSELSAGRSDPGRLEYEEVFGGIPITQHRYHTGEGFPFPRNMGSDVTPSYVCYSAKDCPGIDDPNSQKTFPIIDTLLSIPFSLLHTLPRLSGIVPISTYQQQLLMMGLAVINLWWWDLPSKLIDESKEIRNQNLNANKQDDTRKAPPYPIHHGSRNATTFETKKPTLPYGDPCTPFSGHNLNQDQHIVESDSGLGGMLSLYQGKDGLLISGNDELGEMEDVLYTNKVFVGAPVSVTLTSDAWDIQTPERIEGFDDIDSIDEDVEEKPAVCRSSSDILSWYEQVVGSGVEPLPLTSAPYERGVVGGSSTNDILMIKGLIDPRVYIHFFDLSRFSF